MTAAERAIHAIAQTVPAHSRPRYREEWLADVAGAPDLGLAPTSVVLGAAATAVTMDRVDPVVTGMPRVALAARRIRWALAMFGVAAVLAVGTTVGWGADSSGLYSPAFETLVQSVAPIVSVLATGLAIAGLLALLWVIPAAGIRRSALMVAAVLGGVVMLAIGVVFTNLLGVALVLVGAAIGVVILAQERGLDADPAPARRRIVAIVAGGVLATITVGALGVAHILVWNPLAKVPGRTLEQIYAEMAAAGEGTGWPFVAIWCACWFAGCVVLVVSAIRSRRAGTLRVRRALAASLMLVGLTVVTSWFAGFGMGMGLADTFMTSGYDAAISGPILIMVGQVAIIGAILVAVPPRRVPEAVTAG